MTRKRKNRSKASSKQIGTSTSVTPVQSKNPPLPAINISKSTATESTEKAKTAKRRKNRAKALSKQIGTSENAIPVSNKKIQLPVSSTLNATSAKVTSISSKKSPLSLVNNTSKNTETKSTEKAKTAKKPKNHSKALSKQVGTSANAIPVSCKKTPMSASNTLNATSAKVTSLSSKKTQLSSVKNTSKSTATKSTEKAKTTKKRKNRSKLLSKQVGTSTSVISVNSKKPQLSSVKNASANNSKPVKVNHIVGNSGDIKPVLSNSSKNFTKKQQESLKKSFPIIVPKLVGKFVDDQKRKTIIVEDFEWRRLYEPNLKYGKRIAFDLKRNMETFEHNPLYYEKIDPILKYIMKTTKDGTSLCDAVQGCELVTRRGILTKIATFKTLDYFYDEKLYCQLFFRKFNGVIFACEIFTEEKRFKASHESKKKRKLTYWGHNFEQYMTTEFPNDKPNLNDPVSTLCPQYGVFKTQITDSNKHKLNVLIHAEMDGLDKKGNFIELKTVSRQNPMNQKNNWDNVNKSNWWAQCVLSNVKRVIVGVRDNRGIVTKIRKLHVPMKMNNRNEEKIKWKREKCVNFLLDFCDEVRKLLNSKPEGALLKVELIVEPKKEIKKTWIDDNEREKYEFLLPEFIERFSPAE